MSRFRIMIVSNKTNKSSIFLSWISNTGRLSCINKMNSSKSIYFSDGMNTNFEDEKEMKFLN